MRTLVSFSVILLIVWMTLYFFSKKRTNQIEFLDKTHTNILKGYAIMFVIFGHVGQYCSVNGVEYPAGVGVSIFLVLSGYGIMKSTQNYGLKYFWRKRLFRVFVPYVIAETMFILLCRPKIKPIAFFMDVTLLKPLHPFGWYLHYILICYVLFYIITRFVQSDRNRIALILMIFAGWFFLKSFLWIDDVPFLQARQMLAFPIGVIFAVYPRRGGILKKVSNSIIIILVATILYGTLHLSCASGMPLVLYNILTLGTCTFCALGVIGIVYKLSFLQNYGLAIVSAVSFELYIVHGYFVSILLENGGTWGLIKFIGCTIICTVILYLCTENINKKVKCRCQTVRSERA